MDKCFGVMVVFPHFDERDVLQALQVKYTHTFEHLCLDAMLAAEKLHARDIPKQQLHRYRNPKKIMCIYSGIGKKNLKIIIIIIIFFFKELIAESKRILANDSKESVHWEPRLPSLLTTSRSPNPP